MEDQTLNNAMNPNERTNLDALTNASMQTKKMIDVACNPSLTDSEKLSMIKIGLASCRANLDVVLSRVIDHRVELNAFK